MIKINFAPILKAVAPVAKHVALTVATGMLVDTVAHAAGKGGIKGVIASAVAEELAKSAG